MTPRRPKLWFLKISHQITDGLTGDPVRVSTFATGRSEAHALKRFHRWTPGAVLIQHEIVSGNLPYCPLQDREVRHPILFKRGKEKVRGLGHDGNGRPRGVYQDRGRVLPHVFKVA